jgi:RNA polymerase sigma-70 factor (ECF subfamily)
MHSTAALRLVGGSAAPDPDDVKLVRAVVDGEGWAASLAWHRYGSMVYGLFARSLGSTAECEDLTQEVFASVFEALHTLRDASALRSFIYSCALRRLRSHLRGRRLRSIFLLFGPEELPDPAAREADSEGRETLARFYAILDTLSANDRTAYVLRTIEGLSLLEVAAATGASLATVKRRIARASSRIAELAQADPELAGYIVPKSASHAP